MQDLVLDHNCSILQPTLANNQWFSGSTWFNADNNIQQLMVLNLDPDHPRLCPRGRASNPRTATGSERPKLDVGMNMIDID